MAGFKFRRFRFPLIATFGTGLFSQTLQKKLLGEKITGDIVGGGSAGSVENLRMLQMRFLLTLGANKFLGNCNNRDTMQPNLIVLLN